MPKIHAVRGQEEEKQGAGNMYIQIGVDLIGVTRVQKAVDRWGERFLSRVFTERERQDCNDRIQSLAARFAAKEAVLKVLGTGLTNGICWRDVEIRSTRNGPRVVLYGKAQHRASELHLTGWSLSITHSDGIAVAIAVGYGESNVLLQPIYHESSRRDGHWPDDGQLPAGVDSPSREHTG